MGAVCFFFFSSRRRHTRFDCDWSSDVCSSDLDLDRKADVAALALPQLDDAVDQRLPVAVAREIVVGDEEAVDALGGMGADAICQIVGRAIPALAALNIDDRAERALIGAAAAQIDAGLP